MKLNMGCGHNKMQGFINVDISPKCNPDVVCNLEEIPWAWETNSVDEILFNHSLEHLGADPNVFLGMMSELYRVCKNNAVIMINVPHPRHDNFIGDPTHVRIISPQVLTLFNKSLNDEWQKGGFSNTPFAHYLGVDFEITEAMTLLEEPYASKFQSGEISGEEIERCLKEKNNVAVEFRIILRAKK